MAAKQQRTLAATGTAGAYLRHRRRYRSGPERLPASRRRRRRTGGRPLKQTGGGSAGANAGHSRHHPGAQLQPDQQRRGQFLSIRPAARRRSPPGGRTRLAGRPQPRPGANTPWRMGRTHAQKLYRPLADDGRRGGGITSLRSIGIRFFRPSGSTAQHRPQRTTQAPASVFGGRETRV